MINNKKLKRIEDDPDYELIKWQVEQSRLNRRKKPRTQLDVTCYQNKEVNYE